MGFFDFFRRKSKPKNEQAPAKEEVKKEIKQTPPPKKPSFWSRIKSLFVGNPPLNDALLEQVEEILLGADMGVQVTEELLEVLKKNVHDQEVNLETLLAELKLHIIQKLSATPYPTKEETNKTTPRIILVVGINGVGKTTTIGKLAFLFANEGKRVMIGAGDTFRAAAQEQSAIWGKRLNVPVVGQGTHKDPASVAFDTVQKAIETEQEVVLIDTAGRLHNKQHLMEELAKIKRVINKKLPGAPHEVLLVVDGATGQNAWQQSRIFHEALGVTGLIITKLDSVAKGGVIVGISAGLQVPIAYVGVGEQAEDLTRFDATEFVDRLFQ